MKLARNDITLAHALAKHVAGVQVDRDIAHLRDRGQSYINKRTMKGAFRELRIIFKDRVVYEAIEREKGSRAKGHLFILEPISTGDLTLFVISWIKGEAHQHSTRIVVSHHAVARLMHRTVGEADLNACAVRLKPYVMWAAVESTEAQALMGATKDKQLMVAGDGGVLIFRYEGPLLIAKTWMDAEIISYSKLKEAALGPIITRWWEEIVE